MSNVALGKSCNLSEFQSPHLLTKYNENTYLERQVDAGYIVGAQSTVNVRTTTQ